MSFLRWLTACVVISIPLTASAQNAAPALQEIVIGLASNALGTAGPRLANELGIFERKGLSVRFVSMDSANAATTALISGSMKIVMSGPGEQVAAQGRGQKVVAIANTFGGMGGSLVVSKAAIEKLGIAPDAPVAQRLKALDGLLIASPSATSAYTISYRGALKDVGANVRFTYMAQPTMAAALESGAIQAYIASAPFWAGPVVRGAGMLWISGPRGDLPAQLTPSSSGTMQMMRDTAEANRDLVAKLNDGLAEFQVALNERPEAVRNALAKLYPDLDAATLDLLFKAEAPGWKTRPLTAQDMDREIAFVKANGVPFETAPEFPGQVSPLK
ncbi:ABC transporter substrate-binding protein [Bosea sp. (in: a-proteobacteria)]|uniref:ABC transporter substrate-binding protein n=1 Tax=Bosea sp. (in: a-proteobacteria) TaxID=1871050 RepID=UPI002609A672|nr:ABC transporter substrate-binding protein [Bosea sp. (in: a-proteobacteria)]MCO5090037.1 ABC transporter substrate-binding protein [Bosea sp. (in: a-proteobacteria)]